MPKFSDSPYFLLKDYFDILSKPPAPDLGELEITPYSLWETVNFCDWETSSVSAFCEYKTPVETKTNPNKDGVEWENWTSMVKWNAWYEPFIKFLEDSMLGIANKIIVEGGNFVDLYIKDENESFKPVRLKPIFVEPEGRIYFQFIDKERQKIIPGNAITNIITRDGFDFFVDSDSVFLVDPNNNFLVQYVDVSYSFDEWNLEKQVKTILSNHIGQEVYFRKDSPFYTWLKESAYSYYLDKWETDFTIRNYVNTDKNFIYFGQLYTTRRESDDKPLCYIKFDGMKTFVSTSIPSHQRTPNLVEFLDIYFDRVYNEVYNLKKDIFTLYDPMEVDEKYLNYLANQYYIDMNLDIGEFDTLKQRDFVKNLPSLLKKKGTYVSIQILWKIFSNTINWIDIYNRWHNSSITGQVSASDYVDISYLNNYTKEVDTTDLSLSTAYKVELNLNSEPLEIDSIITEYFCNILYNSMELVRPINRVASYFFSVSPKIDMATEWTSLYSDSEKTEHMISKFEASAGSFVDGAWIHIQNNSLRTWTIDHGLNTTSLIVRVLDFNNDELIPEDIEIINPNRIKIYFDNNIRGIVLIKKSDRVVLNTAQTETWMVNHNLSTKELLIQFKEKDNKWYYPKDVTLIDVDNLEVDESTNVEENGTAMLVSPDYSIQIQPTPEKTWTITHNLNKVGVISQFYDSDNKLINPEYYKVINSNIIEVEFEEAITGYAVVEEVGNYILEDDIISGNLYVKVGTVEDSILSDGIIHQEILYDVENIDGSFYITFILPEQIEGDIREIGIFEMSDDLLIAYTKCYPLYKHKNFEIKFSYEIIKE